METFRKFIKYYSGGVITWLYQNVKYPNQEEINVELTKN